MAFGKRKVIEDELPAEEAPVETPEPEVVPETTEEAPKPVVYAPGEGSMNHPF